MRVGWDFGRVHLGSEKEGGVLRHFYVMVLCAGALWRNFFRRNREDVMGGGLVS